MWKAMDIENTDTLHEIVEDTLREARHKQKNLCIHHFIERMRERNVRIPDPGTYKAILIMTMVKKYLGKKVTSWNSRILQKSLIKK